MTSVVVPTSTLGLAIPEPSREIDIVTTCRSVDYWAATTEDVRTLKNVTAKLTAIDRYVAMTSTRNRGRLAATLRRLEVRIGELLGPATQGQRTDRGQLSLANESLTANERRDFRDMAAHSDKVEKVIDESSDERPASRRAVLAAVRHPKQQRPRPEQHCPSCGAAESHWQQTPKGAQK